MKKIAIIIIAMAIMIPSAATAKTRFYVEAWAGNGCAGTYVQVGNSGCGWWNGNPPVLERHMWRPFIAAAQERSCSCNCNGNAIMPGQAYYDNVPVSFSGFQMRYWYFVVNQPGIIFIRSWENQLIQVRVSRSWPCWPWP